MENNQPEFGVKKVTQKIKDGAVYTAATLSAMGSGSAFAGENTAEARFTEAKKVNEVVTANPDIFTADISSDTYEASWDNSRAVPEKNNSEEKKEYISSPESATLDLAAYFETGSAELKTADIERIKTAFSEFLTTLPEEIKLNLQAGEMTIVVEASSSPDPIKKAIEVIPGSGLYAKNNEELSRYRAEAVMPILESIVAEQDLSNIHFEVLIPKGGVSESKEKKVSIRAEYNHELYKQIFEQSFGDNTLLVIMDESASMLDKRDAAKEVIDSINTSRETPIEIITLQGGSIEMHLKTMEDVILTAEYQDTPKYINIITDEMDETIENTNPSNPEGQAGIEEYKQRIKAVIEEGKSKNIYFVVNYMNNGITKTTHFIDNPEVLLDSTPSTFVRADGVVRF